MEGTKELIDPLLHEVEALGKTSLKIMQLKAIEKTGMVIASLVSNFLVCFVIFLVLVTLNIAFALWLGELFGKTYYGFLLVGLLYALLVIILMLFRTKLKGRIGNYIITKLIN
jgi:phosphoglycerol transferase MdoB-like AlkP superfamily enzyme